MPRAVLVSFVVVLLGAPVAGAAVMGELPFERLPDRAVATCLRSSGPAGGLALLGSAAGRRWPVDLWDAGATGTARGSRVDLGRLVHCPATATAAGRSAVVAGVVAPQRANVSVTQVRAVARDPGGAFGAPVALARGGHYSAVTAAVSATGHAVVAWAQQSGFALGRRIRVRFVASRRSPAGRFGPVEPLTPWRAAPESGQLPMASAIDGAGTATVAWLRPLPDIRRISGAVAVEIATGRLDSRFATERVAERVQDATRPALAVAADGWALLAHDHVGGVTAYERPPGAERFTDVPVPLPRGAGPLSGGRSHPVAAIRDGGGALVAWRTGFNDEDGVAAATRAGAGPFARTRAVAPAPRTAGALEAVGFVLSGPPVDVDGGRLQAALAADGRALLAWTAADDRGIGARTLGPRVAAGTLVDGFRPPIRLGSRLRSAGAVAPMFLSGGQAGVAWTDNASRFEPSPIGDRDGRLHLAIESAPTRPSPPPPRISLRAPTRQRLFASSPLRVVAHCDRACDVHATVGGSQHAVTGSRSRAGRIALRLARGGRTRVTPDGQIIQLRRSRQRVVVRAAAPNGRRIATASRIVRVLARPALPIPRPRAVRARRDGDAIIVTWHTATPARRTYFSVEPRAARRGRPNPTDSRASTVLVGRGRTRFRTRLLPHRPAATRWVRVTAASPDDAEIRYVTTARVRTR